MRLLSDVGEHHGALAWSGSETDLLLLEEQPKSPQIGERAPQLTRTQDAAALQRFRLSRREREVLAWVAQGKTNSDIATILGSKVGTVRKHLEHVFQKLGVETRTAAAAMILQSP